MRHAKAHPTLYGSLRLKSEIRRHKEVTDKAQCIPYRVSHIHINPMQQYPIDSIMNHKSYQTDYPETNSLNYYAPIYPQFLNPQFSIILNSQLNITVLFLYVRILRSMCFCTARLKTIFSRSLPLLISVSMVSLCVMRTTSCSMIGPASSSVVM